MNMNTIPKASDARTEALKNPSFERKVELYNSVVEKIKEASSKGKTQFTVNEEEYLALDAEILAKGYKSDDGTVAGVFLNCLTAALGSKTYYFN